MHFFFKVWNTASGDELLTLDGHRNVVYAIAFNNPWGNKIITGSFDKTCKLWNAEVCAPFSNVFGGFTAGIGGVGGFKFTDLGPTSIFFFLPIILV